MKVRTILKVITGVALFFGANEIIKSNVVIPKGSNKFMNAAIGISSVVLTGVVVAHLTDEAAKDIDKVADNINVVKKVVKVTKTNKGKDIKIDVDFNKKTVEIKEEEDKDGLHKNKQANVPS